MDIEKAKQITAGCVANAFARTVGEDYVPLPKCSLEEMLVANRIVDELPNEEIVNADGSKSYTLRCRVDPRSVAAAYAFENYGSDPIALMESLGFKVRGIGDE